MWKIFHCIRPQFMGTQNSHLHLASKSLKLSFRTFLTQNLKLYIFYKLWFGWCCIICMVFYACYSFHGIHCIVFYALYSIYIVFYALYCVHCTICIVFFAVTFMFCILCTSFFLSIYASIETRYTPTNRPINQRTLSHIELLSPLKRYGVIFVSGLIFSYLII